MFQSALYNCKVMHYRSEPIERRFSYNIFMWYLNLDDLPTIAKSIGLVSHNKFNYYSFKDQDHLKYVEDDSLSVKDQIKAYAKDQGVTENISRIMLLTNLKTLGYQFNPVSFYYCFSTNNEIICAIAEVGNTYREMKPYFIGKEHLSNNVFRYKTKKLFYVSPFIDHDIDFDFTLPIPEKVLNVRIDDYKDSNKFFTAILAGKRKKLNNRNVLISAITFPLITIQIIVGIHYQALLLWLKKIPYHRKNANSKLQVGVYNKFNH